MSVVAFPQRECLVLDANGYPDGHYAAMHKVKERFKDMINELPGPLDYLNIHDAEVILDVCFSDYLRSLPRVR